MKNTVAGFARIQCILNSGESSYGSRYLLSCRAQLLKALAFIPFVLLVLFRG